jgi:hydroxymethylpyrimidine pyrophosphatase-like HAD family hydrolase
MEIKDVYHQVNTVAEIGYNGRRYHREIIVTQYEDSIQESIIWYYGNQCEENIMFYYQDGKWYENIDSEIEEPEIELDYNKVE